MERIYLIDDNLDGNREKYGATFVEEGKYSDVFLSIEKISVADDLEFVNHAACILIHGTLSDYFDGYYHEDSQKVVQKIRGVNGIGESIPFVVFSDGFTSERGEYSMSAPHVIYRLNKRAFYSRLEPFVVNYQRTGTIELSILAYGENYVKDIVEDSVNAVFLRLQDYNNDDTLNVTKIACSAMQQIIEMSQPKIGFSYIDLINHLQDTPVTVGAFKNKLNNILDSFHDYGKNYYIWK